MENSNLRLIFLLVVSTLALTSCIPRATTQSVSEDDYFVFSEGSRWVYTVKYVHPTAGVKKAMKTYAIDGKEMIRGHEYYRYVGISGAGSRAKITVSYYRKTNEGIYRIAAAHKEMSEHLLYRFPLEIGRSWTVNTPEGERHYTVESIETVYLPKNKYEDCVKICWEGSYESRPYKGCTYAARGVGDVKVIYELGGIRYEMFIDQYIK